MCDACSEQTLGVLSREIHIQCQRTSSGSREATLEEGFCRDPMHRDIVPYALQTERVLGDVLEKYLGGDFSVIFEGIGDGEARSRELVESGSELRHLTVNLGKTHPSPMSIPQRHCPTEKTLDYAIVFRGTITLELEDGERPILCTQRGTLHTWRNESTE
ncbi:hypothetical protein B0H19DRAFT_1066038 [Mycena capillaripes]|nr:hypothetical protein B0H19DRAFT_1066038 [Mycena capillaripes]